MVDKRGEKSPDSSVNRVALKNTVKKKVDSILSQTHISEKEVYNVVRDFFKKHLEIDYEFTHQELSDELKKVYLSVELQSKVHLLLEKISEIEHTTKSYSKEELVSVLKTFRGVIDELIVSHYEVRENAWVSFWHHVHDFFTFGFVNPIKKEDDKLIHESERTIVKLKMLLENARRWSKSDLAKAKDAYKELNVIYNDLPDGKKESFYNDIQEIYSLIKNNS